MTCCFRGHDIAVVGRSRQRMCRECLRSWNRDRNRRRRSEPTYRAAENLYKSDWWYRVGRFRRMDAQDERDRRIYQELLEQLRALA